MHKLRITTTLAWVFCVSTAWGANIAQFSPQGTVSNVESIKLSFNKPVIAFGDGQAAPPVVVECNDPELKGSGRWLDGRRWTHVFEQNPGPGVMCTAKLDPAFKALNDEKITGKTSFSFQTGGPIITNAGPYSSARIAEDQIFILRFNGSVDPESLISNSRCLVEGVGEAVPLRLISDPEIRQQTLKAAYWPRWNDDATQLVQCARRLPAEAKIELSIGPGVTTPASEGRPAQASKEVRTLSYNVRPDFKASFSCKRENSSMPCTPVSPVTVSFSAPISQEAAKQIRLKTPSGEVGPDPYEGSYQADTTRSVRFSGPFPEMTSMTVSLPEGLQDDAGRPLSNAERFPLTFQTAGFPPLVKFSSGTFGVIERFADAGPGQSKADAQASVPLTVRNVEPGLATRDLYVSAGTVSDYVAQTDREVLQWYTRVNRLEDRFLRRNQIEDVMASREISRGIGDSIDTRGFSVLQDKEDARTLKLPGLSDAATQPFEVIGVPVAEPGFHVLEVESAKLGQSLLETKSPMYVRSAVLVTTLGVHVKTGRDDVLAWVTTLDGGQVVPDAQITILDCAGDTLAEGKTNAEGVWHHQGNLDAPDYCRTTGLSGIYVSARIPADHPMAEGKADFSFVLSSWNDGIESWRFNVPTNTNPKPTTVAHTVFDRTLFRAGETVSMKHFIRTETRDGLTLPESTEALPDRLFIVHDGSGQHYEQELNWEETPSGGLSASSTFDIPATARLGTYSIRVTDSDHGWYGSGEFRVEEFKLPLLTGTLKISDPQGQQTLVAPTSLDADVQLAYVSGGGAGQLPVQISGVIQDRQISFPDYDDYSFQAPATPYEEDESYEEDNDAMQSLFLDKEKVVMDAQGGARLNIASLPKFKEPKTLLFEASFSDPNGQIQTLTQSVPVWTASTQVGLRAGSWINTDKPASVSAVALSLDGQPQANVEITITGAKRTTYSTRKRMVGGFYSYDSHNETTDLGTLCQGRTDADGLLTCSITFEQEGRIELTATVQDDQGRSASSVSRLWVSGSGRMWFGGENDDRIDLIPAKREWAPGETAEFQVRMPFPEATALVAVEREGVLSTQVVHLSGADPTIKLPVQAEWGPNVYVSVLALRGRQYEVPWSSFFDQGWKNPIDWYQAYSEAKQNQIAKVTPFIDLAKPAFRFGLTEIRVSDQANELMVKVQADKPRYQVRDQAVVSIEVKLPDGEPAAHGTVAFAAVDQALLELAPNNTWDLLTAMRQLRSYGVETATAQMQVVGRRHYGRKAVAAGGGGGSSPTRELLDTLLLWEPSVALDENGKAEIKVPLNDALTQFQFVAVADYGPDRFGTGKVSVVSTQDLQVIEGLPALVREGDQYQATVTLRNTTKRTMNLQVTAAYEGTGVPSQTLPSRQVEVAAGSASTVSWEVLAPEGNMLGETSSLKWTLSAKEQGAEGEAASDAVSFKQSLMPAVAVKTRQATLLPLDGDKPMIELPVSAPVGALLNGNGAPRGGLAVTVKSSLAGGLPGVHEWFINYRYTCLEQVSSKAIVLGSNADWDRIMSRLPDYLDSNGLASYFPGASYGSEVLTAYLLGMSHEAQEQGLSFVIPEQQRQAMLSGLLAFAQGKISYRRWAPMEDLDARKLMALEALSRYDMVKPRMLDSIQIAPNRWPTSAVINWMALLMRVPGIPNQQDRLEQAKQIILARMLDRGTEMVLNEDPINNNWWLMAGRESNQASLLMLLADQPEWEDELPRLAMGLLSMQRNGAWRTTTSNLLGTLAIEKFSKHYEAVPPSGKLRVALDQTGQAQTVDWDSVKANSDGVKEDELMQPWGGTTTDTLQLAQEGPGRAWAIVRSLAAVPVKQDVVAGFVLQRSIEPVSQAVPGVWSKGDVYRVTVNIDSKTPMTWVVLTDPIPAGSTVLGSGLGRDSSIATQTEERDSRWYDPSFVERSFEGYRAYYDYLPKGKVSLQYTVRLNTPGEFQMPSTRIEAMYEPDVFGELAGPNTMKIQAEAKP